MRARIGKKERLTRVAVRMPEWLRKGLTDVAVATDRSLNYEIIVRLKASIELDKLLDAKSTSEALEMLDKLRVRLRQLRLAGEAE